MEKSAPSTREDILATALQLFTTQGYASTSLRQIADRLGFTKAALYYHFPAKEHLIIEVTRPWLDAISNLLTLTTAATGAMDEPQRRAELISDYVDIWIAHHAIVRLLVMDVAAQNHPDVGKRARTLIFALQDALAGPEADDPGRVQVACALGAVHALATLDASMLPTARPLVISMATSVLGVQPSNA